MYAYEYVNKLKTDGLHERIKNFRTELGLTQKELGALAGINRVSIAGWESASGSTPKAENLLKLCQALDEPPDYLIVGTGPVLVNRDSLAETLQDKVDKAINGTKEERPLRLSPARFVTKARPMDDLDAIAAVKAQLHEHQRILDQLTKELDIHPPEAEWPANPVTQVLEELREEAEALPLDEQERMADNLRKLLEMAHFLVAQSPRNHPTK